MFYNTGKKRRNWFWKWSFQFFKWTTSLLRENSLLPLPTCAPFPPPFFSTLSEYHEEDGVYVDEEEEEDEGKTDEGKTDEGKTDEEGQTPPHSFPIFWEV